MPTGRDNDNDRLKAFLNAGFERAHRILDELSTDLGRVATEHLLFPEARKNALFIIADETDRRGQEFARWLPGNAVEHGRKGGLVWGLLLSPPGTDAGELMRMLPIAQQVADAELGIRIAIVAGGVVHSVSVPIPISSGGEA